jgi:beta-lactam-binding protein with PASTA domain
MKKLVLIGMMISTGCAQQIQSPALSSETSGTAQEVVKTKSLSVTGAKDETKFVYTPQDDEDYVVDVYPNKGTTIDGVNTSQLGNSFERSNNAIKLYNRSQYYVYRKNYDSAIYFVNQSLLQVETSEALALKGSILYLKGLPLEADTYWQRAIKIDSTIILPNTR